MHDCKATSHIKELVNVLSYLHESVYVEHPAAKVDANVTVD